MGIQAECSSDANVNTKRSLSQKDGALVPDGNNKLTRRLSYRKDDRAMRPIYGCPKNFRESLTTPTATFPEIFNGLLFRLRL